MKSCFEWLAASLCLFTCCISRSDRTENKTERRNGIYVCGWKLSG